MDPPSSRIDTEGRMRKVKKERGERKKASPSNKLSLAKSDLTGNRGPSHATTRASTDSSHHAKATCTTHAPRHVVVVVVALDPQDISDHVGGTVNKRAPKDPFAKRILSGAGGLCM